MAKVDTNLLARLGFVMKTDGSGERITLELNPRYTPPTDPGTTPYRQTGWADIDFSVDMPFNSDISLDLPIPANVTPAVSDIVRYPDNTVDEIMGTSTVRRWLGVKRFMDFVKRNPIHVTAINLRASSVESIPQQIVILSPDIAGGQMQRQVIDVASRKNAYQYQNDIITIDNLDMYIGRDSIIRFEGNFVHNWPQGATSTDIPCFMDLTIDRYISLEKALVENIKLLSTATGQADAINQEVAKAEAQTVPTMVLNTPTNTGFDASAVASTVVPVMPSLPQFQSKRRTR